MRFGHFAQLHVVLPQNTAVGGVSNCSEGVMGTYNVTRGPHYDANAAMTVPEPY